MPAISKAEFARKQGLSRARITQYVKEGILKDSLLPDGKLDLDLAERELGRNQDEGRKLDYELRTDAGRSNWNDHPGIRGPPPPFTGNIFRDSAITALTIFYPYFLNIMAPIYFKILIEFCHISKESAEQMTILFGFKTHEIIKAFLEKDLFNRWLRKNLDTSLDELQKILFGGRIKKTGPPKNLPTMEHGAFILELLKNQKQKEGTPKQNI